MGSLKRERGQLRAMLLSGAEAPLGEPADARYFDELRQRVPRQMMGAPAASNLQKNWMPDEDSNLD